MLSERFKTVLKERVADNPPAGPGKHYGVTWEQWSDLSAMKKQRSGVVVVVSPA